MIRRNLLLRSRLPPEAILEGLRARAREWRESDVPAALREHGVHGVQISLQGTRFRMQTEPSSTDRFELRCKGSIDPDGTGSVVRCSIRQDNPPLWIGMILLAVVALTAILVRRPDAIIKATAALVGWSVLGGILALLGPNQRRHEAELAELEKILEGAAWPSPGRGSDSLAV